MAFYDDFRGGSAGQREMKMSSKTLLSAALAVVFCAAILAAPAAAHGPGNHDTNHGATQNTGNKPVKTKANSAQRRKRGRDANEIDPAESDGTCSWVKKNGHRVKVCSND